MQYLGISQKMEETEDMANRQKTFPDYHSIVSVCV
jgi:hypothetical protein